MLTKCTIKKRMKNFGKCFMSHAIHPPDVRNCVYIFVCVHEKCIASVTKNGTH